MDSPRQLVIFNLDERRYALHLPTVERIVMVAEITPLPKAPQIVLGVINIQGRIIPVINVRKRFNLPEREITLSDHLIIANTTRRTVVLVVDAVSGVVDRPEEEIIIPDKILPGLEYVQGVMKLEDGLILIHNLEMFLSLEEEIMLEQAIGSN
ncbi:MAG: chemotaxis protein CheW [Chthoniobacteraceae bacterium]